MKHRYILGRRIHAAISRATMVLVFVLGIITLQVSGQQIKINSGAWLQNTGATIVVNGKVDNTGTITNSGTGTLKLTGDWLNSGTYIPTGCTVILAGTLFQTLGGANATTFENLTLNNSAGAVLSIGITVTNALTLTSGKITTGSNTLSLGNSATVTGAGAGKYVYGNMLKGIAASTASKTFEIGDALYYTPVLLNFAGTTNGTGSITASTTSGDHPNIGSSIINPALSVNRYWTLTNANVSGFSSYDATFTFNPADVDPGADYSLFIAGKYLSGAWSYPVTGAAISTSTQATGVTSFGDFQLGQASGSPVACLYGDDGITPIVADIMPCIANPVTVSTSFATHQYFTMNVINGITYQVYTCNTTSPSNPLKMVVYKEGAPADAYLAFSYSNSGNPCSSAANNVSVSFTPAFSGEVRVLINRTSDCSSITPSGLTVNVNVSGGSNLQDNQSAAGTDSWIGQIYDGTNAAVAYNGTFSPYLGYYPEAETFNESFGGNTNCFGPVNSNGIARATVYTETFSVRYRMNSTRKGLYVADLGSDDGSRLTVDGTLLYNNWSDQSFSSRPRILMSLTGASALVLDYYENAIINQVVFQNLTLVLANTLSTNISQNICLGNSGSAISGDVYGTLPSGITLSGTGYQWTYSTTPSGTRTVISGATASTYTPNSAVSPFNVPGTYYIFRNTALSSVNNVSPNPYVATNESNASTITINTLPVATFSYTGTPYCSNAANPFPTFSGAGVAGTFSSTTGLIFVSTATGQVNLAASTPGTYTITNTIAASGGCGVVTATSPITITTLPAATISYAGTPFCKSIVTAQPVTRTGSAGGTYTASPAGLSIDAGTGGITSGTSTAGTYTITYTIAAAGGCGIVTATTSITITALPLATFSYTGTPYCANAANPFPVFNGGGVAGTFSSTTGLIFVSTATGQVNLATSTAGSYTVTNTIAAAGGCGIVTATSPIIITALPLATFSYPGTPYCANAVNPFPTYNGGGSPGIFSSTTGLNFVNTATGQVNLATSTPGTYTVTNTFAASWGCGIVTATTSITITALPLATFSYTGTPYCANAANPYPTFSGGGVAGTFSSTTGLIFVSTATGQINIATSTPGTYTVTNTIAAAGGCGIVTATTPVTITALPVATFSYTGTPYCANTANPYPTFSGGGVAGTFSSTTGLIFVSIATGQVNLATSTPGAYTVTNTIAASSGCGIVTATSPITITTLPAATISYAGTPFCKSIVTAQPVTRTGTAGGTYTASPAGLSIDAGTGAITPGTSSAGTYTVTYTIATAGGCGIVTATTPATITALPLATFSYTGTPYCANAANPSPVFNGGGIAGTFSSTTGLIFVSTTTGQVNLVTSTPGTYTVTNTIAASGGCGIVTATSPITITVLPVATFSYTGTPYCSNAANPFPTFNGGGVAGIFSSTTGLIFVSTATGQVNLAASATGTYTVTNTIAASGGCGIVTATSPITITTLPAATISYAGTPFCKSIVTAQPVTRTGTAGGTYTASPPGLSIDAGTGAITPGTSTAGTYTVTYTIAAGSGCGIVTATTPVTITAVPAATISYAGAPFCKTILTPQSVTLNGTGAYTGGTYSSSAGLTLNSGTGAITPGTSTAGVYTVTYTILASGGCAAVPVTTSVTITTLPIATFSYAGTAFPVFSGGGVAGIFSSTAGLVFVNTATGQVNLTASTPGTYTVTNTIAASGGCGIVTATSQITITSSQTSGFVWGGSISTDWNDPNNWTTGVVPGLTSDVIIPDASTTLYDPGLPASPAGAAGTILIQSGGILNGGTATILTVAGSGSAWQNAGVFNAGTSTVIFTNAAATIGGTTNFYNVTIATGAGLTPGSGNIMRIAGALTLQGTGVLSASLLPNTIEFNGANQSVINPNGSTPGYYNLILSGSGTKTLPGTALAVYGNFSLSGTASTTAGGAMSVTGNFTIGSGTAFTAGAFTHFVGGNWTNGGTFTATGSTINFNGASANTISASNFNNITISGAGTKSAIGTISVSGNFNITSGQFILNNSTTNNITISGNYIQTGGVFDFNSGTTSTCTMFLGGNLSNTAGAGSMTTSGAGAPNGVIVFNGPGVQTLSIPTPGAAIWIVYSVPSGNSVRLLSDITLNSADGVSQAGFQGEIRINGTFDLGTSTVTVFDGVWGTAVFTVNSGAYLITANAGGISGSVPQINMTTTYSSNANYEFRGASTGTFTTTPAANTVNNLIINYNPVVTLTKSLTVAGTLSLTNGTLTLGADTLTISGSAPVRTSGSIDAGNAGATLAFTSSAALILPASVFTGNINNLTINDIGGITIVNDIGINGVLNLESANPSAYKGSLDMWDGSVSKILTMGGSATTIGAGDVTGIVKRTSFVAGISYSFGNQFTTLNFQNVGILPADISIKTTIGVSPTWKPDGIQRIYAIIRTGGSGSFATLNVHYLDTELNGNAEDKLVAWVCNTPFTPGTAFEFGRSNYDITDDWVGSSGFDISLLPTSFNIQYATLGVSLLTSSTWNGSQSTVWTNPANWSPFGIPSDNTDIIIPDAATTPNDPTTSPTLAIGRLTIESGGIVNASAASVITISGASGAWSNNGGLFNPGTSTVIFTNAAATISGVTNFYNVTINSGAGLSLGSNDIMRIAGTMTNNGIWRAAQAANNTVEYNGGSQTVLNPNGLTSGYDNLILSGSGTKTMPGTALSIGGYFSMSGTASTTAIAVLTIAGGFSLGPGTTFNTGAFNHSIGGNFSNNGIFTATGSTITFNGILAQTIGGTTATTFNNLTSDNAAGAILTSTALTTVLAALTINSGKKFGIAPGKQLTALGTITNNSGKPGFVLQSDTTGTASLLHNTYNVPATEQRYISGAKEAWHFLSTPVSGQAIGGSWLPSGTYGNDTGYDLYVWNEPSSCWIYKNDSISTINWKTIHPGVDFIIGRGYLYSVQAANPTKAFAGNLNNGYLTYGLTFGSSNSSLKGFNLVGNPYPSSIDWQAASGWTRSNLVNSGGGYDMWIWNPTANNYGVFNSATGIGTNSVTRYIAPMQGFFVQASGAGNLGFDNPVRVHNGASGWFKNSEIPPGMVSVVVQSETNTSSDEINILFGYTANQTGAAKLFSQAVTAPSLFMLSGDPYCSVRYLTDAPHNPMVPVLFKPGEEGIYTLRCDFNSDDFGTVMLEDLPDHYIQNMKTINTYRFHSSMGDDVSRFILHFGADNSTSYNELPARIYSDGSELVIDLTLVGTETEAFVCDMLGRVLLHKKLQGSTLYKFDISSNSQILMVYLRNPQGNICRKLYFSDN